MWQIKLEINAHNDDFFLIRTQNKRIHWKEHEEFGSYQNKEKVKMCDEQIWSSNSQSIGKMGFVAFPEIWLDRKTSFLKSF